MSGGGNGKGTQQSYPEFADIWQWLQATRGWQVVDDGNGRDNFVGPLGSDDRTRGGRLKLTSHEQVCVD